ncbi:Geranylgeranyl transferase type-1 subunit beta [Chytriomyces hyalinus]|nr:Geranylgeranyl transferase type-1 subunit beta [Chytriomyces hyalinus]
MTSPADENAAKKVKTASELKFPRKEDVRYFGYGLNLLPSHLTEYDTSRMAMAFYSLSGLDICGAADSDFVRKNRRDWIDWVYAQQVLPSWDAGKEPVPDGCSWTCFGFRGSPSSGRAFDPNATRSEKWCHDTSHVAMTYTALALLVILGDDLSRVNRVAIVNWLKHSQTKLGSFVASEDNSESDMRFLFSACSISYILNDFSGIDKEAAVRYILNSKSHENAFGQGAELEAHGGSTYCAVASLALMDRLDALDADSVKLHLIEWLLKRQQEDGGFAGRPGKVSDTCYSFWIGGTLEILGAYQFVDADANRAFLETTVSKNGGFSKVPDCNADPLHSYMGLAGLSVAKEPGLLPLVPTLNLTERAACLASNLLTLIFNWFKVETMQDTARLAAAEVESAADTGRSSRFTRPMPMRRSSSYDHGLLDPLRRDSALPGDSVRPSNVSDAPRSDYYLAASRPLRDSGASVFSDSASTVNTSEFKNLAWEKVVHKLFKSVPQNEPLFVDYLCAFQGDHILHQGKMYLTPNFEFPIQDILLIERAKTAYIIPNAIIVATSSKAYFFTSFVNREHTFMNMEYLINRHRETHKTFAPKILGSNATNSNNGTPILKKSNRRYEDESGGATFFNSDGGGASVFAEPESDNTTGSTTLQTDPRNPSSRQQQPLNNANDIMQHQQSKNPYSSSASLAAASYLQMNGKMVAVFSVMVMSILLCMMLALGSAAVLWKIKSVIGRLEVLALAL